MLKNPGTRWWIRQGMLALPNQHLFLIPTDYELVVNGSILSVGCQFYPNFPFHRDKY
jgi:hypothetical protein